MIESNKDRDYVASGHTLCWGQNLPALDGVPVTQAKSIRSLGMTLNNSLKMEAQVFIFVKRGN